MVTMERDRIEPAVSFDLTAVPAEFTIDSFAFAHASVLHRILTPIERADSPDCQKMAFVLLTPYIPQPKHRRKRS